MTWNPDTYTRQHAFIFDYGAGLLDLLAPRPGEVILDLGCGTGELTAQLAEAGAAVVGLDASADMLARAREQFPGLDLRLGDGATFALPERFDAIFSNAALHWMTDPAAVAGRIYQHLKPGGRLVAELGGQGNMAAVVGALRRQLGRRGHPAPDPAGWWYFPALGEYATVLERAGLRVRQAAHFDRPTPLTDPTTGLRDWIRQFGAHFFAGLSAAETDAVLAAVEAELRPTLFRKGRWVADYVRLRVVAERPG